MYDEICDQRWYRKGFFLFCAFKYTKYNDTLKRASTWPWLCFAALAVTKVPPWNANTTLGRGEEQSPRHTVRVTMKSPQRTCHNEITTTYVSQWKSPRRTCHNEKLFVVLVTIQNLFGTVQSKRFKNRGLCQCKCIDYWYWGNQCFFSPFNLNHDPKTVTAIKFPGDTISTCTLSNKRKWAYRVLGEKQRRLFHFGEAWHDFIPKLCVMSFLPIVCLDGSLKQDEKILHCGMFSPCHTVKSNGFCALYSHMRRRLLRTCAR